MKIDMYRSDRRRARVRRCAGRGEVGEFGEKRKWMFCFADVRADEERMFARASVEASEVEVRSMEGESEPLEGDILLYRFCGSW